VRVQPLGPTRALVEARFEVRGTGPLRVLITWFPGQRLEDLRAPVDGQAVAPELSGADTGMGRVEISSAAAMTVVMIAYRVTVPDGVAYRYPLPVPEATPDAATESVHLMAIVPSPTWPATAGFPRFRVAARAAGATTVRADLVAVPGFTHLPYGPAAGTAGELPLSSPGFESPAPGFGANFYGFFLVAGVWCALYFGWALRANRRRRG